MPRLWPDGNLCVACLIASYADFDAGKNLPRIVRVLMVRGRHACEAALITTFGANTLGGFRVWADGVEMA